MDPALELDFGSSKQLEPHLVHQRCRLKEVAIGFVPKMGRRDPSEFLVNQRQRMLPRFAIAVLRSSQKLGQKRLGCGHLGRIREFGGAVKSIIRLAELGFVSKHAKNAPVSTFLLPTASVPF